MPTEISAPLHFRTLLTGHKYLIVDFYATWCPPCKQIAPIYNQLATQHGSKDFAFVKVNVDEQREVAAQYGVTAMPTFLLFKDGKQIEEIRGADVRRLNSVVEGAGTDVKSAAKKEDPVAPKVETKMENNVEDEKAVSGSYGMTGGKNWKMSLH